MSKLIANPSIVDFGNVETYQCKEKNVLIQNKTGKNISQLPGFDIPEVTVVFIPTIISAFPPNATIYLNENYEICDSEGQYFLTDLGYGKVGSTDANGTLTVELDNIPEDTNLLIDEHNNILVNDDNDRLVYSS